MLLSDYYFFSDYRLAQYRDPLGSFLSLPTEAISQLYLTGVGNRSFFDARTIYYLSFSGNQDQVPVIHPVIDYNNVINSHDLRRRVQLQDQLHQPDALHRGVRSDHDARQHQRPVPERLGRSAGADAVAVPAARHARHLHACDGGSAVAANPSPIRSARSGRRSRSCAPMRSTPRSRTSRAFRTSCPVGDTQALRVMPAVGLEYRYPFINVQPWGTTTIEPIAQVIIRPERDLCRQAAQ